MSMKKSDLQKAIDRFNAGIAKHQDEIVALENGRTILEGVLREKTAKTAKSAPAKTRKPRTVKAAAVQPAVAVENDVPLLQ